jgi:hypothetical protein
MADMKNLHDEDNESELTCNTDYNGMLKIQN